MRTVDPHEQEETSRESRLTSTSRTSPQTLQRNVSVPGGREGGRNRSSSDTRREYQSTLGYTYAPMLREVLRAFRRPVHELVSVPLDGQPEVFALESPSGELPAGWVEVDFQVRDARKAELLVDPGGGFEALAPPLPRNGRIRAIAQLPACAAGAWHGRGLFC